MKTNVFGSVAFVIEMVLSTVTASWTKAKAQRRSAVGVWPPLKKTTLTSGGCHFVRISLLLGLAFSSIIVLQKEIFQRRDWPSASDVWCLPLWGSDPRFSQQYRESGGKSELRQWAGAQCRQTCLLGSWSVNIHLIFPIIMAFSVSSNKQAQLLIGL